MRGPTWNRYSRTLAAASALLLPRSLLACSTCFGQSDSALAEGMNWGILTLLAVVVCVLGGMGSFVIHMHRRTVALRREAALAAAAIAEVQAEETTEEVQAL